MPHDPHYVLRIISKASVSASYCRFGGAFRPVSTFHMTFIIYVRNSDVLLCCLRRANVYLYHQWYKYMYIVTMLHELNAVKPASRQTIIQKVTIICDYYRFMNGNNYVWLNSEVLLARERLFLWWGALYILREWRR